MSNSVQGETMDLDLNQEPSSDSGLITELSPWLNELETAHERIEERIRHLEAIISRIRIPETTTTTTPSLVPPDEQRDSTAGVIHERSRERLVENGENKTYLISKALNMEKTSSVPGGYFDCNICLEKAENPILTCCGHLFCWGCFYQLPLIYLNIKECPVCDGEVTDTEVIPIYGNGDDSDGTKPKFEDCAIRLPPRPNAKRVESVRQKIINRSVPFIPGHETLEHIRRTIDSIGLQALAQGDEFGLTNIITNGGDNGVQQQQHQHHHHPPFGPLSFVDTRRNRRRPSPAVRASYQRIRNNNNSSQTISFSLGAAASSSPREFAVPRSNSVATRNQSVNPTEVVTSVTSASSSRRRTEDVNSGPQTRSRRRLR
ncbi:E3 ubiquitin-protein ligase RMA1H1 [Cardamine amara subsp. amara]|uniref:E3 ubiquitin-protein ligase RMA n=1 Tax=Cardamine amara subsp. amara TaxID=228776 RepID=A0ABD1B2A8_CARAN